MNKINLNWKVWLVALGVVAVCACSENEDLSQVANKQNYQEGTRTANWYTKEVTLEEIGTLEVKLTEVMDGEPLDTLEKLVISGPMAAADFNYLKQNLIGLDVLDMKDAYIRASENRYSSNSGSRYLKNDTVCERMFYNFKRLKEVVLPSSLLYIEDYAFANCDNLSEIDIPSSVTQIDSSAFMSDKNLKNINI